MIVWTGLWVVIDLKKLIGQIGKIWKEHVVLQSNPTLAWIILLLLFIKNLQIRWKQICTKTSLNDQKGLVMKNGQQNLLCSITLRQKGIASMGFQVPIHKVNGLHKIWTALLNWSLHKAVEVILRETKAAFPKRRHKLDYVTCKGDYSSR